MFAKLLTDVERAFSVISAGIVCSLMLLLIIQAAARYLFTAIAGIVELVEALMVGVIFLGLAYAQSQRRHIHADFLSSRLSSGWRQRLDAFTVTLALGFFIILTYRSGVNAYKAWAMAEYAAGLVQFQLWPFKMIVPIGSGLLCLRFLVQLLGPRSSCR